MKRAAIIGLLGLNIALVVALFLGAAVPPARAQGTGPNPDYLAVAGSLSEDTEVVYIVDQGKHRMIAVRYDLRDEQLVGYRQPRSLRRDFQDED
jgi:hypothetical protein